jgi:hypothetical protein
MSSLLGEAIVDAKALRESALKNAESTIIEKYSDEVKKTLEQLLEQEEDAMGLAGEEAPDLAALPEEPLEETGDPTPVTEDDIPLAATDDLSGSEGQNLSDLPKEGEEVEVTIDLGALQESIEELAKTLSEDEEVELDLNEEDSKPDYIDLDKDGDKDEPMKKAAKDAKEKKEEIDEEIDIDPSAEEEEADDKAMAGLANLDEDGSDALVDAVMEKLTVDMGFELSGWAGRPTSQLRQGQEMELAAERKAELIMKVRIN